MASKSVDVLEIRIPLDVIKKLSPEDRYSYYLMGHMFNELMFLQKLIAFALPTHDDRRVFRLDAEMSQAMFLFRMSSSKVWEAIDKIRSKQVAATLRSHVVPNMPDGAARLKAVNATVNAAKWLKAFRNGMGFHYPSFEQWAEVTTPDDTWIDDGVLLGPSSGNTFYHAADTIAQHWTFQEDGQPPSHDTADARVKEMIQLLRTMTNYLEEALGALVASLLDARPELKPVGKVAAPDFHSVVLPFWTFTK